MSATELITTEFGEKVYLVALGVLLTFLLQVIVALIKLVWDRQGFRQQIYLFGCSLEVFVVDGISEDTEWLAKNLVYSFSTQWRSKTMSEDFRLLLGIYLYAKKNGYSSAGQRTKEYDISRIRAVLDRYS